MVLAHVANRLSNLVSVLTVQVFKDNWTRPTAYQVLGDSTVSTKMGPASTAMKFPMDSSHTRAPPIVPPFRPVGSSFVNPRTGFPAFPSVGASGSASMDLPLSIDVDNSFGPGPALGHTSYNPIDLQLSSSYQSLPNVLPASGGVGTYSPTQTGPARIGGNIVGLPVNKEIKLGLQNRLDTADSIPYS